MLVRRGVFGGGDPRAPNACQDRDRDRSARPGTTTDGSLYDAQGNSIARPELDAWRARIPASGPPLMLGTIAMAGPSRRARPDRTGPGAGSAIGRRGEQLAWLYADQGGDLADLRLPAPPALTVERGRRQRGLGLRQAHQIESRGDHDSGASRARACQNGLHTTRHGYLKPATAGAGCPPAAIDREWLEG